MAAVFIFALFALVLGKGWIVPQDDYGRRARLIMPNGDILVSKVDAYVSIGDRNCTVNIEDYMLPEGIHEVCKILLENNKFMLYPSMDDLVVVRGTQHIGGNKKCIELFTQDYILIPLYGDRELKVIFERK